MRNQDSPRHVVLVGPMGSGKTTIGQRLAARLRRPFVDIDARVEVEAGFPITEIFARHGESGFRERESLALHAALEAPPAVLATGGGAVLDPRNRDAMRRAGHVVYLQVPADQQLARLSHDSARPLLRVAAPDRRLAELQAQREPLYREVADVMFDTGPHTPESAALALAALLGQAPAP